MKVPKSDWLPRLFEEPSGRKGKGVGNSGLGKESVIVKVGISKLELKTSVEEERRCQAAGDAAAEQRQGVEEQSLVLLDMKLSV